MMEIDIMPKEKAEELINKFKDKVNPYIGSDMLSNTHDDDAILWQSKKCALIVVEEVIKYADTSGIYANKEGKLINLPNGYWAEVKRQIELKD